MNRWVDERADGTHPHHLLPHLPCHLCHPLVVIDSVVEINNMKSNERANARATALQGTCVIPGINIVVSFLLILAPPGLIYSTEQPHPLQLPLGPNPSIHPPIHPSIELLFNSYFIESRGAFDGNGYVLYINKWW